ncbi:MAG: hypothetical protein MHPSP_002458, partial [Paramarteilia canceri]
MALVQSETMAADRRDQMRPSAFLTECLLAFKTPLGLEGKPASKWPRKLAPLFECVQQILADLEAISDQENLPGHNGV